MSTPEERTLAAWRVEALAVLARAARARGIDGLTRAIPFRRLLNVVGRLEVELAIPGVAQAPTDAEVDALMHQATSLLGEYPRLKALAQAGPGQKQLSLLAEPPAPAPPAVAPPAAPPSPKPYRMDHLADPLFAREMTDARQKLRDLGSPQALAEIHERQQAALTAFFAAPPASASAGAEPRDWSAHFELGDALEIVTSPLTGLPSFIKALTCRTGATPTSVLAANLRSGVSRTRVPPSAAPYTWSAGAFDDDVGEDLKALELPAFPRICATAFRLDATGAGQRLEGMTLSPGRAYRLLVPPGIATPAGRAVPGEGGDWQIVDLELPAPVPAELEEPLARLGFGLAKTGIDVDFTALAAREYRAGRGGERYPCFRPDDRPVIRIAGVDTKLYGEVVLFLDGPEGQRRFELPPGREHLVALGPLPEGRYALDVLAADPARTPERLFFAIDAQAGRAEGAAGGVAHVTIGGERLALDGDVSLELDLAELSEANLRLATPPLHRVGARWEGARSRPLPPLHADAQGEVSVSALLAMTAEERTQERLGDLSLDFGYFGRLTLQHTRDHAPGEAGDRLRALWSERAAAVLAELDAELLATAWLGPVCAVLGYRLREAPALPEGGPALLAVFGLETTFRDGERIATEQHAGLLLARRGADLRATGAGSVREAAGKLGKRGGYARVVLTDGLSWGLWERGRSFAAAALDVREALGEGGRAEEMVERFHA
jgi:hypothetical protein